VHSHHGPVKRKIGRIEMRSKEKRRMDIKRNTAKRIE